ncbi:MAG: helix-turn-helix transcriptional regulator [Ruminococcus sp.]|nr:helix-turn-helix transcriptional regulator [Ruminococcus sp.]
MGYSHKHNGYFMTDRPYGIENWLLLIVKAPVVFVIDGKNQSFFEPVFMLYPPGTTQYYYANGDSYCNDWMEFRLTEDELTLLQDFRTPVNTPAVLPDAAVISSFMMHMNNEFFSSNPHKNLSISLYFRLMLCKLSEMTMYSEYKHTNIQSQPTGHTDFHSKYYDKLLRVRSDIYQWPGKEWHIEDMAKEVSLSSSYFQHLYTKCFGISVNQDIITSRVNKAFRLLRDTDWPVKEIGLYVGYRSVSYFIKQFKAVIGSTPEQVRKKKR